jgi:hypothetical protein
VSIIIVIGDDSTNEKTKSKRSKVREFWSSTVFLVI